MSTQRRRRIAISATGDAITVVESRLGPDDQATPHSRAAERCERQNDTNRRLAVYDERLAAPA